MPVPTIADVLKQSGFSQEQIDALDAKLIAGMKTALSGAEQVEADALKKQQEAVALAAKAEADRKAAEESAAAAKAAQEAAELQKRSVDQFWNDTYNPGVAAWEAEKAKLAKTAADAAAEAAYYKAQREGYLKVLNIDPANAPEFVKPAPVKVEPTPGTPTLVDPNAIASKVIDGAQTLTDIQWRYQSLYGGQPMPIAPSELVRQADAVKLSPADYAARTFKFAEKEAERLQAAAKAHDEEIRAAATAASEAAHKAELEKIQAEHNAKLKTIAETSGAGANPDLRTPPGSAKFAELRRAQQAGERPDPTKMTQAERRAATFANIHKALEEREMANQ